MPLCSLLVCVGDPKRGTFPKGLCNDLQADWQVVLGKAAGERNGRQSRQIKGIGKARAQVLFIWVYGFKGLRWTRRSRRGENIHPGEVCTNLLIQGGSGSTDGPPNANSCIPSLPSNTVPA